MANNPPTHATAVAERLRRVAHEMRTPLNAILGFAQLLRGQTHGVTPTGNTYLGHIELAAVQLSAMVDDLAAQPHLDLWTLSVKKEWVALQGVAQIARALMTPDAAKSGMRIEFDCDEPGLMAYTDPTRVLQVLLNLLSNAIKYGRGPVARTDILLDGHSDPRFARLSVQDHGPGLTAEQMQKLFQPFERLGAERTSTQGTGIGLHICRSIARAMGGDVEVAGHPGGGSVFTLVLPRFEEGSTPIAER